MSRSSPSKHLSRNVFVIAPFPTLRSRVPLFPLPCRLLLNWISDSKQNARTILLITTRGGKLRLDIHILGFRIRKMGRGKGKRNFFFRFSFLRIYFGFGLDWLLGTNFWKYAVNTLRKLHGVDSITLSIMQKLNPRKTVEVLNLLHFVPRKVWNRLYAFNVSFYYGYSLN